MIKKVYQSFFTGERGKSLFYQQFDAWETDNWNDDKPNFFDRLNNITDERSFVILSSTILEYQVDKFLEIFIPNKNLIIKKNQSDFYRKITTIRAFNLIPNQIIEFTDLVRNIRNEFAHHLNIDNFSDAHYSKKLPELIRDLEANWKKYESEMTYGKINSSPINKFKDIWYKALSGLHVYEKNIKLFREITENPDFIDNLKSLSETRRKDREEKTKNELRQYYLKQNEEE